MLFIKNNNSKNGVEYDMATTTLTKEVEIKNSKPITRRQTNKRRKNAINQKKLSK